MKDLYRCLRFLTIAGVLVVTLAGCGKEKPEALIESAKAFAANGDYRAAVIQLRNALQKQPENGEARYILGNALNEEMDYITAEKELRKALEYGYTRDGVYPALARAMLGQGQGKQIVAEFSSKTLTDPEAEASLKTDLGLAYFSMGQRDEALTAFEAALTAKSGYGRARIGQAMLLASNKDLAGAMKIVDEVLAAAPSLPDALTLKADLLLAQNDTGGAIKAVEQVAKVQPYNFQARYALATLWIREQKLDDAAAEITELTKDFPQGCACLLSRGPARVSSRRCCEDEGCHSGGAEDKPRSCSEPFPGGCGRLPIAVVRICRRIFSACAQQVSA